MAIISLIDGIICQTFVGFVIVYIYSATLIYAFIHEFRKLDIVNRMEI